MFKKFIEEKGQTIVLVPILLVALMGFAGLAIDGGRLYSAKSQLQKAVDAGALAGAADLLDTIKSGGTVNYTNISTRINKITKGNYSAGSYTYDSSKYETKAVEVHGEESVKLMIMPVLGITDSKVKAVARVKIGNVSKVGKGVVIPVGINFDMLKDPTDPDGTKLQYGVTLNISDSPGTGVNGYYGFLDFSSLPGATQINGATGVKWFIEHGSDVPISIGQSISPENGVMTGPVNTAITQKVGQIVYVPIVTGPNSSGKLVVDGFAAFKLIDYVTNKGSKGTPDTHVIKAEFLHTVVDGDVGGGGIDYGIYDSKLEL